MAREARDFGDAVCPTRRGRAAARAGGCWFAIADVGAYVQTGSPSTSIAYDRATSVCYPRRVIPMLPEGLAPTVCARWTPRSSGCAMVHGVLVAADVLRSPYQFYPAVMFATPRFTRTEVAAILGNTRGPRAAKRKER